MPNCYRRRYTLTAEDRRKGGLARASQPSFYDMCIKGWETACDRHGKKAMLSIIRPKEERKGRKWGAKTDMNTKKLTAQETLMAHVTLSRVTGSTPIGENTYVSFDGKEIGSLTRANPKPGGPDDIWKVSYTAEGKPARLGATTYEKIGVLRIAEHHAMQVSKGGAQ